MKTPARTIILAVLALATALASFADDHKDRKEWEREMNKVKHEYMARELKLSNEQKKTFFAQYDAMTREIRDAYDQTRRMVKTVEEKGDKATDLEREKAAQAEFELKGRENAIEMKYFPKFKALLTPDQLFRLKKAERHFNREMVKKHRKMKDGNARDPRMKDAKVRPSDGAPKAKEAPKPRKKDKD